MPPQSDLDRLKEIRASIADAGMVSQANAGSLLAMREKLTGELRDASTLADTASANADITELEEMVRDRDAENTAGDTADDGKGSHELGTDAVHRGDGQTADDKPTPNAPVDAAAAAEDLEDRDGDGDGDGSDADTDSDADNADDDESDSDTDSDDESDETDADEVEGEDKPKTKAKAKKAKAAKTSRKK